jgi:hypothetical protein
VMINARGNKSAGRQILPLHLIKSTGSAA